MDITQRVRVGAGVAALGVLGSVGVLTSAGTAAAAVPAAVRASATGAVTPSAAATPAHASRCAVGRWEQRVQGAPARFDAGDRGGDYLWHAAGGFRLRVTHRGDHRAVYTGVITANAPLRLTRVHLERGDVARLTGDHRSIVFAFADYGHVDGIDFTTDCATRVTLSHLNVGNRALPAVRVQLGAHERHPGRVPFTVTRAPAHR